MFYDCNVVLLVFLDGLYPCLFPYLVMLLGGVVCHPGTVLESCVSGVFPWVCQFVSVVSCSWRCVFASCDWRETMKKVEWLTLTVLCLHLGVACCPGWIVSVSVSISCNACGRCCVSPWCGTGIWCVWCVSVGGVRV